MFEVLAGKGARDGGPPDGPVQRIAAADDAIGGPDRLASLAALFPGFAFESLGPKWPEQIPEGLQIAIVPADAAAPSEIDRAAELLRRALSTQIIIVLRNADVMTSRLLARAGAADVIPAPVSEPALALSVERLLKRSSSAAASAGKSGQVVALIKAGGGAGATSLGVQIAALLARRGGDTRRVCYADLDVQFGAAGIYFDLRDAFSVSDCLAAGTALEESPFASVLAKHASGARLLAAPQAPMTIDSLTPELVSKLINGLKRNFALTMLDLPQVWTVWTNRALELADRIVIVTRLSVAHVHLVRRQLAVLSMQRLDGRPVILVCNGVNSDQQATLSVKAAERAIGRAFDFVIPEDSRVMTSAANQGQEISVVKRGTKLERSIGLVADAVAANAFADAIQSNGR